MAQENKANLEVVQILQARQLNDSYLEVNAFLEKQIRKMKKEKASLCGKLRFECQDYLEKERNIIEELKEGVTGELLALLTRQQQLVRDIQKIRSLVDQHESEEIVYFFREIELKKVYVANYSYGSNEHLIHEYKQLLGILDTFLGYRERFFNTIKDIEELTKLVSFLDVLVLASRPKV